MSFVINIYNAAGGLDAMETALASLAADTWSSNVAGNTLASQYVHLNAASSLWDQTYVFNAGANTVDNPRIGGAANGDSPWSYTSGALCYDTTRGYNKYIFTGGGHGDWYSSAVFAFNWATALWNQSDTGGLLCRTSGSGEDVTLPFNASGNQGWRVRRNAGGRFTPISQHTYSGNEYMAEKDRIFVGAAAVFPTGQLSVGGVAQIDASTGQWSADQYAHNTASGIVVGTDSNAFWLAMVDGSGNPTGTQKLWRINSQGGYRDAQLIDPDTGAWEPGGNFFSANFDPNGVSGTVIPDPVYGAPFQAFIGFSSNATRMCVAHKINVTPNPHLNFAFISFASSAPMPGAISFQSKWYYMGYDRPNSNQVVVAQPLSPTVEDTGVAIYVLALGSLAWGQTPLAIANASFPMSDNASTAQILRRFGYHKKYDMFYMFTLKDDGSLRILKRPTGVV